jgi:hypothetical protein
MAVGDSAVIDSAAVEDLGAADLAALVDPVVEGLPAFTAAADLGVDGDN